VVTIELPALRNNREDIPLLIDHFLIKYAWQNRKNVTCLSAEASQVLMDYAFPGNTRELENIIKRAIILTKERRISVQDLPKELTNGPRARLNGHRGYGYQRVNGDKLLDALKSITISDNGAGPKQWHSSLKCVSIEAIHEFLLRTYRREFSRLEFTRFLDHKSGSDRNKYGTAGKYLAILRDNRICVHNEKKANQSRFRLAEAFAGDA
jgi:DNA-binding NtrC family response regulator